MGELICERAGVLNLGIEGIMTAGAFSGWLAVYMGADLWCGVAVAAIVGATLRACCMGCWSCRSACRSMSRASGSRCSPRRSATTSTAWRFPEVTSPPKIEPFQPWPMPVLSEIPVLGPALFQQTPLTYLAFVMVVLVAWFLYRTPLGLAVRTVGENPAAVEAQGINVTWRAHGRRDGRVSALMGVGGSFLTLSAFNSFFFEMMNGRGWICIALVVFGAWRPGKALLGAVLFGAFDAYQMRLQQLAGAVVPYQLFLMLPFVLSILALIFMSRRVAYPRALMVPYRKGER